MALTMLAWSLPAGAFQIDWDAIGWNPNDGDGLQSFSNVDGSGIDIDVSYTTNGFDNNGVPNLYDASNSPTPEIFGTLRVTNDRTVPIDVVVLTITFSEDVFLNEFGVESLSRIVGLQENSLITAYDANGTPVLATSYGTTTPGLVELDTDGDASYQTRGVGRQSDDEYGNAVLSYTEVGIRSIDFGVFVTEIGGDALTKGFSSQGIRDVSFESAVVIPEPGSAALMALGLLGLARASRVRIS